MGATIWPSGGGRHRRRGRLGVGARVWRHVAWSFVGAYGGAGECGTGFGLNLYMG